MATTKQAKISDLVPDDRNFNKHSEYGMSLLEKSVGKFGMGRSILLDKNNRIIAGNGITETAGQLGFEDVEIVESDGSKIIAVKRTDIDLDTPEGRELALADNATNKANLTWDFETIEAVCPELEIEPSEWGIKEWEEGEKDEDYGTEFNLPDGEKKDARQITFTFTYREAALVDWAVSRAKAEKGFATMERHGNDNENGNALFYIAREWLKSIGEKVEETEQKLWDEQKI